MIAGLARLVTEAPWTLRRDDLTRARESGLEDATVLHVIVLASFFGYLNRVADAVGIELDYEVAEQPPPADPATPPLPRPDAEQRPDFAAPRVIELGLRPGAVEARDAWREYVMGRPGPLSRPQRESIAAVVADATGDEPIEATIAIGRAVTEYVDTIARAPWRLGAAALEPLRALGFSDAALFDVISTASHQSFVSRLNVALAALSR